MIKEITGESIKGLTFSQPLNRLTLFLGPNGSGKSARTQALILALWGYIPGGKKLNQEIFANFASPGADKLVVGFRMEGGDLFQRGFMKGADGSVKQGHQVNGKRVSEKIFHEMMGSAGAPKAIDIGAFMTLSDQKKIDAIFELYPPAENMNVLLEAAEKARTNLNELYSRARAKEDATAEIIAARAALQLPSGTLAEITGEIMRTEVQLENAEKALAAAREEIAKAKAVEEEKKRAQEAEAQRLLDEAEKKENEIRKKAAEKIPDPPGIVEAKPAKNDTKEAPGETKSGNGETKGTGHDPFGGAPLPTANTANPEAVISIQGIIDAIKEAGCDGCAARLIAIREMKKYRKEVSP